MASEKDGLKDEFAECWTKWERYQRKIHRLEEESGINRLRAKKELVYRRCCEIQKELGLTQGVLKAQLRKEGKLVSPTKPTEPVAESGPTESEPVKKAEPSADRPAHVFGWEKDPSETVMESRTPKKRPPQRSPAD